MLIREAKPSEAKQLTAIAVAAKQHWGYSPEAMNKWIRTLTVTRTAIESNPTFVAEADTLLGFYMLWTDGRAWELEHMWVAPPFMRQGVGRALLAHSANFARARDAKILRIDADPNAEAFYRACGAVRLGVVAAPIAEQPQRVRPILTLRLSEDAAR